MTTWVQLPGVLETTLLHDTTRSRITGKVVRPDLSEVHDIHTIVQHQLQGLCTNALVPIGFPYPIAYLAILLTNGDIALVVGKIAYASDGFFRLIPDNRPCAVVQEELPNHLSALLYRLVHRPSGTWSHIGIGCVLEKCFGIRFLPTSQCYSCCFHCIFVCISAGSHLFLDEKIHISLLGTFHVACYSSNSHIVQQFLTFDAHYIHRHLTGYELHSIVNRLLTQRFE